MVRRPYKKKKQTTVKGLENQQTIQTSIIGMENNFHDINAYHSFQTKFMFLNEKKIMIL